MKKVLIVTYSFPPAENTCARRADSFVRQISKYGWEPLILTSDIKVKTAAGTEEPITASMPEGIDIIRTGSWQGAEFLSSLLIPDKKRLWELLCVRKALRLAKSMGVDLIYTLSPPSSTHLIGLRVKKKLPRIPWVADFCEAAEAEGRGFKKLREQYNRKLVNSVLDGADCIITGDSEISSVLKASYDSAVQQIDICHVPDGQVQELSEQFEKACRIIAARKLNKNDV